MINPLLPPLCGDLLLYCIHSQSVDQPLLFDPIRFQSFLRMRHLNDSAGDIRGLYMEPAPTKAEVWGSLGLAKELVGRWVSGVIVEEGGAVVIFILLLYIIFYDLEGGYFITHYRSIHE